MRISQSQGDSIVGRSDQIKELYEINGSLGLPERCVAIKGAAKFGIVIYE